MSTVRIPPTLRTSTGGEKLVSVPGGTVREVIAGLVAAHPALGSQLLADDGDLNASSTRSSTTPTSGTSRPSTRPSPTATRWSCCRRWPGADPPGGGPSGP